jgi:hypothetical protein
VCESANEVEVYVEVDDILSQIECGKTLRMTRSSRPARRVESIQQTQAQLNQLAIYMFTTMNLQQESAMLVAEAHTHIHMYVCMYVCTYIHTYVHNYEK